MKMESIPKSGRVGWIVYINHPHYKIARTYVKGRNPRTRPQQDHRFNVRAVAKRWHQLTAAQRAAWAVAAATHDFINDKGVRVRLSAYHFFMNLNTRRADLNLPQFDLPPHRPGFGPNPVKELAVSYPGGRFTLKLRVSSPPSCYMLVQGPKPTGNAVRCVQHWPLLGLMPPEENGWIDITELYVARYGVPPLGKAIWIRTCQHIDGWTDAPKITRVRLPAATPKA